MLCTVEDIRERAHAMLNTWDAAHITETIAAVAERIARETGRVFGSYGGSNPLSAATAETRIYEALNTGYCLIEDVLRLDEVAWAASDTATPSVTTVYRMRRNSAGSIFALDNGMWDAGNLVYLTGVFGYTETVPADIWDAAVAWTIRTLKEADAAYQDATAIPEMGQLVYRKAIPGDVRRVLARYERHSPVARVQ